MPTDAWFKANPKISGYVPQTVYDCLIQFKDERGISISQAVTIVLSEYFGVDRGVGQSSFAGVTLTQVQELEQGLANLAKTVEQRFQELEDKLESIETFSSLLIDHSKLTTPSLSSLTSEPVSELSKETNVTVPKIIQALEQDKESSLPISNSKPLSETVDEGIEGNTQAEWQDINSVLLSELQSEPVKVESEEMAPSLELVDKPREILSVQPLSATELSQRLGVDQSVIGKYKNGRRKQNLAEWSRSIDPEGVAWEFSEELKRYIPSEDVLGSSISSLQSKLLTENQHNSTELLVKQEIFEGMQLTSEQLAARLGIKEESLRNRRAPKQIASFPEWSRSRDPDGVAWHYLQESKLYYFVSLPSKLAGGLLNFDYKADSGSSSLNEFTE